MTQLLPFQYVYRLTRTVDDAEFGFYFAVTDVAARDAFLHHSVEIPVRIAAAARLQCSQIYM